MSSAKSPTQVPIVTSIDSRPQECVGFGYFVHQDRQISFFCPNSARSLAITHGSVWIWYHCCRSYLPLGMSMQGYGLVPHPGDQQYHERAWWSGVCVTQFSHNLCWMISLPCMTHVWLPWLRGLYSNPSHHTLGDLLVIVLLIAND